MRIPSTTHRGPPARRACRRGRGFVRRADVSWSGAERHQAVSFQRGVNLNTWLKDEGYLVLKEGKDTSGDWFQDVDWSKTRAFTLGLTGIFLNKKGRERDGVVEPGAEADALAAEINAV